MYWPDGPSREFNLSYKPVVNGKASICNWDLRIRFHTKEQVKKAIQFLLEMEINFDFSVSYLMGDSVTPDTFIIDIDGMSWANNLQHVAEILKDVDYNDEG